MSDASPYERFRRSMDIGFEEWHDGIGYDLDALAEATPEDRTAIETLLVPRAGNDWRDVEALAALGTPGANRALADAFATAGPEIRVAILRGTLDEHRSVPVHYAAMLLYLHGQAAEPFDWEVRPFVLRFAGSGPDERRAAYRELCQRIGR